MHRRARGDGRALARRARLPRRERREVPLASSAEGARRIVEEGPLVPGPAHRPRRSERDRPTTPSSASPSPQTNMTPDETANWPQRIAMYVFNIDGFDRLDADERQRCYDMAECARRETLLYRNDVREYQNAIERFNTELAD